MTAYWLGVLTTPVVVLAAFTVFAAWLRAGSWLHDHYGISFEAKATRGAGVTDYVLRHHVWWERSYGPVFVGGWYREQPVYGAPPHARFNRWVGLGRANGPCLMVFRVHDLGEARP